MNIDGHLSRIKIAHIVPTFYPASYFGGPVFSVYGLCNALARRGDVDLRVLTTDSSGPSRMDRLPVMSFPAPQPHGYEICYCRKSWGKEFSFQLLRQLLSMVRWADVVHLTGVYSFTTLPVLFLCRLTGKPVVWSPRGALQRWEGTTHRQLKAVWEAVCNRLLRPDRSVLHATSTAEGIESGVRISRARIEIVPNGVEIPPLPVVRSWMPGGEMRLLYLGRLHPKKGIESLIRGLGRYSGSARLTICGSGAPDYEADLRTLVGELGLQDHVQFAGHVTGEGKWEAFREADVCIVPSYTENFGMVVAESLAHGVPVIVNQGLPWDGIANRDCGLVVPNDAASLAMAIDRVRRLDLSRMGQNGRRWMEEQFSWDRVAERMHGVYRTLTDSN